MTGDAGWVSMLPVVVAVAASLMAVVLGVDQLTSGARLRNLESMLRGAKDHAQGVARETVLASLHTATVGRLVARAAVPGRKFALPTLLVLSSLTQTVGIWSDIRSGRALGYLAISVFGTASFGAMGTLMLVHLMKERARVARCYRKGVVPIRAYTDILALMEGGWRDEFWRAYISGLALVAGGIGLSMLVSEDDVPVFVPLILLLVTVVVASALAHWFKRRIAADVVAEPRNRDGSLTPTWSHPTAGVEESPSTTAE